MVAKRKGVKIFIHGVNFSKSDYLELMFIADKFNPVSVKPIFKNGKCLGAVIPHMGDELPIGHHQINVELTLNGQQFTDCGQKFLFN